jgi:hypothetical protein
MVCIVIVNPVHRSLLAFELSSSLWIMLGNPEWTEFSWKMTLRSLCWKEV